MNAKRKNRKVDRFNPGQLSIRNKATGKRNYAPFRQLSHGPLDLRGIIEKNEHVAAILFTLQSENDKLSRKLSETQSLLNKKKRAQVIEKDSSKQTTLLQFFRPKAAGGDLQEEFNDESRTANEIAKAGYDGKSAKTLSRHLQQMVLMFEKVTHGDPDMQLQLLAAVSDLFMGQQANLRKELLQLRIVAQSVQHFFSTLKSRYNGRFPNNVRAAFQAVASAVSCFVPAGGVAGVARLLDVNPTQLHAGQDRWQNFYAANDASLVELRGKKRSDEMPQKYIDFAHQIWVDNTRPSELKSDCMKNPNNKDDNNVYQVHFLEMRVEDMHTIIVSEGEKKFSEEDFHWSEWYTRKVRPFFVKNPKKKNCLCPYHMRFNFMVIGLFEFVKCLRRDKLCLCTLLQISRDASTFRRSIMCEPAGGNDRHNDVDCIENTCETCKDMRLLKFCEGDCFDIIGPEAPAIKFTKWTIIGQTTSTDGKDTKQEGFCSWLSRAGRRFS